MRRTINIMLGLALAGFASVAVAGPFEDGASAYRRNDYRGAMTAWRPLADKDATVQNNYGVMYMNGYGVPRDYSTAMQWFSRSAASGSSLGQNNLGGLYRDGRGVARDYGKALTFFTAAAQQGNAAAQVNLGLMLVNGQGARPDPVRAYMWFDLAAALGVQQGATNRNILRQRMSAKDVATAAQLSQRCRAQNFKNCG